MKQGTSFFQYAARDQALPGETLIFQGAESLTFITPFFPSSPCNALVLRKHRPPKPYRHEILDRQLTKHRILSESRNLQKARKAGIRVPAILMIDLPRGDLYMCYIDGTSVRDHLLHHQSRSPSSTTTTRAALTIGQEIGKVVAHLHKADIIHGDLTTSNLLLSGDQQIWVIDFGLSSVSLSIDDMAVDLYVLQRSLSATHSTIDGLMESVMAGYEQVISEDGWKKGADVMKRLELVRARGRKRTMIG